MGKTCQGEMETQRRQRFKKKRERMGAELPGCQGFVGYSEVQDMAGGQGHEKDLKRDH